jgi:hypothetical protein
MRADARTHARTHAGTNDARTHSDTQTPTHTGAHVPAHAPMLISLQDRARAVLVLLVSQGLKASPDENSSLLATFCISCRATTTMVHQSTTYHMQDNSQRHCQSGGGGTPMSSAFLPACPYMCLFPSSAKPFNMPPNHGQPAIAVSRKHTRAQQRNTPR